MNKSQYNLEDARYLWAKDKLDNYKKENYMTKVADFDQPSEIHCWRCDETADLVMIMNKIDNKYDDIPKFLCTHHYLIEHRNVRLTP